VLQLNPDDFQSSCFACVGCLGRDRDRRQRDRKQHQYELHIIGLAVGKFIIVNSIAGTRELAMIVWRKILIARKKKTGAASNKSSARIG
jgi:hypothetical protein